MEQLKLYINELETQIKNKHLTNAAITKSSVGWQIDHCLIVINGIINQLKKSNANEFTSKFNFKRAIVFTTKYIPRGKARAPKTVNPEVEATEVELLEKISLAKNNLATFDTLEKNNFFAHPYFGNLNVSQTKKFLTIHTFHHLKIIRDLVR